jgi:hypothetical protein
MFSVNPSKERGYMVRNSIVQVPMNSKTYDKLKALAEREERSIASLVRYAVKLYLENEERKRRKKYKVDLFPHIPE